jgi:hypothetical protein
MGILTIVNVKIIIMEDTIALILCMFGFIMLYLLPELIFSILGEFIEDSIKYRTKSQNITNIFLSIMVALTLVIGTLLLVFGFKNIS